MLFKSFLRPHEEGSETCEGPVNITEYKCAAKHNFGWIFLLIKCSQYHRFSFQKNIIAACVEFY